MENVAHDHNCTCTTCREAMTRTGTVWAKPGQPPSEADVEQHMLNVQSGAAFDPPSGAFPVSTAEDVAEQKERALTVLHALEACREELLRLECIPTNDADDCNALSAAKGYAARAAAALRGRFAT